MLLLLVICLRHMLYFCYSFCRTAKNSSAQQLLQSGVEKEIGSLPECETASDGNPLGVFGFTVQFH